MKLQNILLPENGTDISETLFFQPDQTNPHAVWMNREESCMVFQQNAFCSFSTYFNSFSGAKWKKYTNISEPELKLSLKGRFRVVLVKSRKNPIEDIEEPDSLVISSQEIFAPEVREFTFPCTGAFEFTSTAFELYSLQENSCFYGGSYEAEIPENELNDVRIALNICTFKREKFVLRNLAILKKAILENPESELHAHLKCYIQDNGSTLPLDEINSEYVQIVQNKNTGGAGGFTRGLIEILKGKEKFAATHALMMDDDIVIFPEALFRTYTMLRCRKAEYAEAFIGGAMLRLDSSAVQHESGAEWNAGALKSLRTNIDLRELSSCIENEEDIYSEYNAWWYCCTPMSVITPENLPMPIFIRGDDLEYGLRNMKNLILLNGICVWHEPFENKYSSFLNYYIYRNMLYVNSLHFNWVPARKTTSLLFKHVLREILYFRYLNVKLLLRGVRDYLKGVDFLLKTDGAALHQEIMAAGYKAIPEEPGMDLGGCMGYTVAHQNESESFVHRLYRVVTFNGLLLPAKRVRKKVCVPMANCKVRMFFRAGAVYHYDASTGKYFLTKRSVLKSLWCLCRLLATMAQLHLTYWWKKKTFKKQSKKLMNMEFWNKYLDLNPETQEIQ